MRAGIVRRTAAVLLAVMLIFSLAIQAAALDNTYRFDEFEMSVKFPKDYYVVTRDTSPNDAVFSKIDYDYASTKEAFHNGSIYLFAYDPEKTFQISLTVTEDADTRALNNYSDLTSAERKTRLDDFKNTAQETGVELTSAVEKKHGGNIFFDYERIQTDNGKTLYISVCDTVINGRHYELTLQKNDEPITPEESKVLEKAANSMKFDKIRRNTGAVFEWWRLLLWAAILVGFSVAITVIYRQYNAANKRKLEERRSSRRTASEEDEPAPAHAESETITFEESLGYKDDEEFAARADADEMAASDIKIREQNSDKGIQFFEDGGSGIDDGTDYFDTYFKEPVEKRSGFQKAMSAVGSALRIAFTHTGYFFKNLFHKIFKKKKKDPDGS